MLRISVAMSPHIQQGKPTGYYMIAERLFAKKIKLVKRQFLGFSDGLLITVGGIEHREWDSVLKMAINLPTLAGKPVNWLTPVPIYNSPGGFRSYIPGKILKPTSPEEKVSHLWGEFCECPVGDTKLYFVRVPLLDGDVLLGRRKIDEQKKA
jgi:hypothetical protein